MFRVTIQLRDAIVVKYFKSEMAAHLTALHRRVKLKQVASVEFECGGLVRKIV